MPIRFRCAYCNRLLGIATRKAGTDTTCPHCGYTITVPTPEDEDAKTERMSLDDVGEPFGHTEMETAPRTAVVAAEKVKASPVSRTEDRPLFEDDIDAILGSPARVEEPAKPKPPVTSGMDALELAEPARQIVMSGATAVVLLAGVVVLLVAAFVAGYMLKG